MPQDRGTRRWKLAALAAGLLLGAADARAWEGGIPASGDVPLVAVDKSRQRLVMSGGGTDGEYFCSTGQKRGDKEVRGDLKTPEGVYFIVGKRTAALDFQDYGGVAYPLDYPNPVDRLRGKTGSGIWLHSRGRPLTPYESHGCVVVNLDDMAKLGDRLKTGTPVILAERIRTRGDAAAREARVARRTRGWFEAWRARGEAEDYYAASAQGKALADRMRREREKLLRGRKPVRAEAGPVRVLEGPGYWVSWFSERISLEEGELSGIRRLYWQEDGDGALRIVGTRRIAKDGETAP